MPLSMLVYQYLMGRRDPMIIYILFHGFFTTLPFTKQWSISIFVAPVLLEPCLAYAAPFNLSCVICMASSISNFIQICSPIYLYFMFYFYFLFFPPPVSSLGAVCLPDPVHPGTVGPSGTDQRLTHHPHFSWLSEIKYNLQIYLGAHFPIYSNQIIHIVTRIHANWRQSPYWYH
jgi:hypothetical protein